MGPLERALGKRRIAAHGLMPSVLDSGATRQRPQTSRTIANGAGVGAAEKRGGHSGLPAPVAAHVGWTLIAATVIFLQF